MTPRTTAPPESEAALAPHPTRRRFLTQSGMLVVTLGALPDAIAFAAGDQAGAAGPYPDPDFRQLDSWIVIREDNTVTLFVGKTDLGQGTGTAFRQLLADELDVGYAQTGVVMGSTDVTVDQGGSGGSDALQVDGWPMRRVAAEARRVLLDMASSAAGRAGGRTRRRRRCRLRPWRCQPARHLRTAHRRTAVQRLARRP